MKKIKDLTPEDFPEVDPNAFLRWKEAIIRANRNSIIINLVLFAIILAMFFISRNFKDAASYFKMVIAYFITLFIWAMILRSIFSESNSIAKSSGITRERIRKARRGNRVSGT